jgi:surfactin synthase thioesterase subunit
MSCPISLHLSPSLSNSYSDLITHLDPTYTIYCIDDGVILREINHTELSIEEVSTKCAKLVEQFALSYYGTSAQRPANQQMNLLLGGWSYGGVIAVNVAERLKSQSPSAVEISGVILFDSPLRLSSTVNAVTEEDTERLHALQASSTTSTPLSSSNRIQSHFNYCTQLLQRYYHRPRRSSPILLCPVLDLRAAESTYNSDLASVQEISSGPIERSVTDGTHFTMLFGDRAPAVANIVSRFISSHL